MTQSHWSLDFLKRIGLAFAIACAGWATLAPASGAEPAIWPGTNLLFNGWGLTPAGRSTSISDLPLKFVIAPDKKTLAAVCGGFNDHGLALLDLKSGELRQFEKLPEAWNGLAFSRDGSHLYVSGGDSGKIHVFKFSHGTATLEKSLKPSTNADVVFLASIAVHPSNGHVYVCNEANHEVWVLNGATLALETTIPVGLHPHTCILGADPNYLYVSNWGSQTVTVIDLKKGRRVHEVEVGLRPNDMALAPDGRLFVACSGDNTVQVIQTQQLETSGPAASPDRRIWEGTREIISTSLYPASPEGSTPDAVAVSPDGKTLFVANADNNNVMVADLSDPKTTLVTGFIPVGWYPSALAVAPDGKTLLVGNGKGLASRANVPALSTNPRLKGKPNAYDYIGNTLAGSVSWIPKPDAEQMAAYTRQSRQNSPYTPETLRQTAATSHSVIPDHVGLQCPIQYVLFIIKENRTYDQLFGDLTDNNGNRLGNGDPKLTMYGEKVTPNQHRLVRDYVLLDNLYCNGEVSVDGHSWCDAAIATDYNQRSWIISYSRHGNLPGNREMEMPAAGAIWDLCRRHGVSYRNYGEGASYVPSDHRGRWEGERDTEKARSWIQDLELAEKSGELPRFTIMSLGEDHTHGTAPDAFTPDACVASNDQAVGLIVEAASHSKFWPQMAIFIIEDDAQNGPDHVDAHRTTGYVVSPYVKRGMVDSTLYTTASMIRTIELILGLPPLTQYDAGATPMFGVFGQSADERPFDHLPAQVDLMARNTKSSPGAKASSKMDFREYDRAPEDQLNRILWLAAKGPNVPYPAPIHRALFTKAEVR
jgi:YVTN family beta-propeller protein